MNELKEVLSKLGWSEELIERFASKADPPEVATVTDEAIEVETVDVTDISLDLDEPPIQGGTHLRLDQ